MGGVGADRRVGRRAQVVPALYGGIRVYFQVGE